MSDDISAGSASAAPSSSAPSPDSASSSSAAPASATAMPDGASATVPDPSGSSGEPPRERWADILANTRTKTRSEVEAEYRQKYGWADQFHQEPYAFVESWVDQLAAHPQYAPQILAKAAKLLQSRRGQVPQAQEEPAPDIPVFDTEGRQVNATFSAAQLKKWQQWNQQQQQAAMDQRFQPLEQLRSQVEQAQIQAHVDDRAKNTLDTLRQIPQFKEHEAKVKAALIAHPEWGDNVHAAFNHVLTTEILPGLSQTEQAKVVAHLQQKATGSTVSAGTQTATQRPKFKTFAEASRYYAEHPAEAEAMAKR